MATTARSKTGIPLTGASSMPVCADCSDNEVIWLSLNRGVYLCTECCSIHRSLGRHVSQVKPIRSNLKSGCSCLPIQAALVQVLFSAGSNNVWEHSLLDPATASRFRRKPTIRDPLYPSKADFIKSKYVDQAFVLKPSCLRSSGSDDSLSDLALSHSLVDIQRELNKQLYSCVRTNYVETTMRLLAQGANPCGYFDPDTGLTPMHIAAKEGQDLQIELLYLYGADPGQPDFLGQTPVDLAKQAGHKELASRILELQYETTDRLAYYLCGRRPDHSSVSQDHQHFIVPEASSGFQQLSFVAESPAGCFSKAIRRRMHALSDVAFEKLAQDVYDEVDRREIDNAWTASLSDDAFMTGDRYVAPFLPVNSDLSSIRNQYRQKLAKFSERELAALIVDILSEAKRRCCNASTGSNSNIQNTKSSLGSAATSNAGAMLTKSASSSAAVSSAIATPKRPPHESLDSATSSGGVVMTFLTEFNNELSHENKSCDSKYEVEDPVYDAVASDTDEMIKTKLASTSKSVKVPVENPSSLALDGSSAATSDVFSTSKEVCLEDYLGLKVHLAATEAIVEEMQRQKDTSFLSKKFNPASDTDRPFSNKDGCADKRFNEKLDLSSIPISSLALSPEDSSNRKPISAQRSCNTFRSASLNVIDAPVLPTQQKPPNVVARMQDSAQLPQNIAASLPPVPDASLPQQLLSYPQNLIALTESLTALMQRLFSDVRGGRASTFAAHADSARSVVDRMLFCVPDRCKTPRIQSVLNAMADASVVLTVRCAEAVATWPLRRDNPRLVEQECEQASYKVIQAAYDVAKSAKTLLSFVEEQK